MRTLVLNPKWERCICTTLRQATRVITRLYDRELSNTGLSITNYSLLARIYAKGGITITELADELMMDRTTLTRNLRPLLRKKFVASVVSDDLRRRPLMITDAGQETLLRAFDDWQRAQLHFRKIYGSSRSTALMNLIDEVLASSDSERHE